jgi:hypothetical protein
MTTSRSDAATIESIGLGLPQSALDVGASWDEEKVPCIVSIGRDRFRLWVGQNDAALIARIAGGLDGLAADAAQPVLGRAFRLACSMASFGLGAPGVHSGKGDILLKWRRGRRALTLLVSERKAELCLADEFQRETRAELPPGRCDNALITNFLGSPARLSDRVPAPA